MMNHIFHKFLETFSKYPSPEETENLILNRFNFHYLSSKCILKTLDEDIYIDVTHTVNYPYNSGIQRVVRKLICELKKLKKTFILIKFTYDGQPVELNDSEIIKFYNWENNIQNTDQNIEFIIWSYFKKIIFFMKKFIPPSLWSNLKKLFHYFRAIKQSKKNILSLKSNTSILDLRKKKLLLPEVTTEPERVHAISILSKYYQTEISCILYDLIPVSHPEYCTVGYDFIHYLRIFRSIKKVFSISEHSSNELIHFNKISLREINDPLQVKTIYLGGDFDTNLSSNELVIGKKIILMVARFEPRKNIRRVLAAIEMLFYERDDFKFVLVGNPGWLQEHILTDLHSLKSKGFDIEFHMRVSDSILVEWYQKCFFTIFCSITEGFGLPIVESVLFRKPCITTRYGSQAEVANKIGGCLLVDPLDIQDIYNKVKDLLSNKTLYQQKIDETLNAKWHSWNDYANHIFKSIAE